MSPVGSKFCNDCGAALHLRPCPHCGSVNDLTLSTHCSRCNGELELGEPAQAPIEMPLLNEVIEASPPIHDSVHDPVPEALPESPAQAGRSFAPLIAIAMIAVAVASYYGLSASPEAKPTAAELIVARPAAAPSAEVMEKAATPEAPIVAAEQLASAPAPILTQTPAQEASPVPALAASLAKLSPPSAGRSPAPRREAAVAPAAAAASPGAERYSSSPRARQPGEGLDLKQPTIGTCTDAVAALGLCTQESNPRRP